MRASVDTIQTEGAIHVAGFLRQEELQLASALLFVSTNAVIRLTRAAHCQIPNGDFDRRNERLNKLILTDGTEVLAEAGAREETVNDDRGCEITDHQHGRGSRAIPQAERFVSPEEQQQ